MGCAHEDERLGCPTSEARPSCRARILLVKASRKFTMLIERDEQGYYVATVPAPRECHTQARNLDTLMKRVHEVVELCLD
jgi:hypothetical protein